MKTNEKPTIYGVKTGETIHYIGKTIREGSDGEIKGHMISNRVKNIALDNIIRNNENVVIEPIKVVESDEWYDEKLQEVVQRHAQHHPLVNAQWMLDGKRGPEYWRGKTRDAHTIQRLAESKYTRICQYDDKGVLVKVWAGAKEAAIEVFGDYQVIKNSGKTDLYNAMRATTMKSSFRLGYYWFRASDMERHFGLVPKKLNLAVILDKEKQRKREIRKTSKPSTHTTRATVIQYNKSGEEIQRFDNTSHAAYELKISLSMVQRYCRGNQYNDNYILSFGPKVLQAVNPQYPKYKIRFKKSKHKLKKTKVKTKTTYRVKQHKNGIVVKRFDSICEAAQHFGLKESTIKRLGRGEMKLNYNNYPILKLGRKVNVVVG